MERRSSVGKRLAEQNGVKIYRGIMSGSDAAGKATDKLSDKAKALNIVLAKAGIPPGAKLVPADVLKTIANAFAFPIGSTIDLEQTGSGVVSVAGEAGVTVNKPAGRTAATPGQYAVVRLRKVELNTWTLFGDLA